MGKIIDITGNKYGRLTVIQQDYQFQKNKKISGACWKCKCQCGKEISVRGNALKSGNTKSCGCLHSERVFQANFKNLTGQRFGKLIVLQIIDKDCNRNYLYKCLCDCGGETVVRSQHLMSGRTTSCGCLKSKGEEAISKILNDNKIHFEKQKTFKNCVFNQTGGFARFDFYVNNQYLIEFDGVQHFLTNKNGFYTEAMLEKIKERDRFKNHWCKTNNIPLIRIPYWHLEKISISDLLLETSTFIITGGDE